MLDDLRNSAAQSFEEEEQQQALERPAITLREPRRNTLFLGMTAQQRFVLALMVFLMVVVLGVLFLVATDTLYLVF